MSEKEEDVVDISEKEELNKEERLEAARKKFEDLKKKKKKTKKSKKNTENTDSGVSGEQEGDNAETKPEKGSGDEASPTSGDSDVVEASEKPVAEVKKEDSSEETGDKTKSAVDSASTAEVEGGDKATSSEKPAEEALSEKVPISGTVASDSGTKTDQTEDLASLKSTIEYQKSVISRLRDENTELKLSKMDLQDKISELQKQLGSVNVTGTEKKIQPAAIPPANEVTKNTYASISQQEFASFNVTTDFKDRLMVWKGWQVDMTEWNGNKGHQIAI